MSQCPYPTVPIDVISEEDEVFAQHTGHIHLPVAKRVQHPIQIVELALIISTVDMVSRRTTVRWSDKYRPNLFNHAFGYKLIALNFLVRIRFNETVWCKLIVRMIVVYLSLVYAWYN
ncbi:hypothetical protein PRIPAC_93826 [Pristionchus pacificus]|uniref:Uncharacterized protein n=1 Tax=Pristionchus pacificus TaxID=54126 RepID=A0A2A6CD56_PRIPA|nr:hypothetical protein PRIPAC_93826 [Pristionchus pacificus]|eukprot:PDM76124.1 hypothetical protein PRIPAC_39728 [Pristionchus pacificus]